MPTDSAVQLSLSELFDTLPDNVLYYRAVRDVAGQSGVRSASDAVTDFIVEYTNPTAIQVLDGHYRNLTGASLRHSISTDKQLTERRFRTFCDVLESGQPQETEYFNANFDKWFSLRFSKAGNGVLSTSRQIITPRHIAQETEQQRELLNSVLNTPLNTVFIYKAIRDKAGVIQDFGVRLVNERGRTDVLNRLGVDVVGKTLLQINPNSRQGGQFNLFCQIIESGKSYQTEQFYPDANVWYNTSISKLEDSVVVIGNDITAQKETSLEIEKQKSLMEAMLDGSLNGLLLLEPVYDDQQTITDFSVQAANQAVEQISGVKPEQAIGQLMLTVYPGIKEAGYFDMYVRTLQTGKPERMESYYRDEQGLEGWFEVLAVCQENKIIVTFTNTTSFRRAEQELKQSADHIQAVIDNSQTGIFVFTPVYDESGKHVDFRFKTINRMVAAMVGQTPDVVTGAVASDWFTSYRETGLFDKYRHTYETGEEQRFEINYNVDGFDVWLDVKAIKMNDDVLVTFSDFTALKELQQQLENSVIDLQRSNKNLEQFAYVASHDLQEPLRKIQQFGDILQTSYADVLDESGRGMLTRMQSAADRMRVLIKDVLAYSRITTKRENARSLDLNALIGDVLTDLEAAIAEKRATLHIDSLPTILGDAAQMRQLFQNLISNALKFNKPTIQPELRLTSYTQQGRETGMLLPPADETKLFHRIELSDNGIGFDPTHADKIFQVFQRLHTRNEYVGTGIGLAIVQKVIENHQGYIRAEGKPGEGATFIILLPA